VVPKAVHCLEKDLEDCIAFYSFPYRYWVKIRTTNIIERAFREFRRRIRVMDSFPTEESCVRIMFALAKLLNESWEHKLIKGF
jgi:putative transposase